MRSLSAALESANANGVLIGGHAANCWRRPRYTAKVSVLVAGALESVADALSSQGFSLTLQHRSHELPLADFVRMDRPDTYDVVELYAVRSDFQQGVLRRAVSTDPDSLSVATPEDILVLALIDGRLDDRLPFFDLAEAQPIDWEYVDHWAKIWDVSESLKRLRAEMRTHTPTFP